MMGNIWLNRAIRAFHQMSSKYSIWRSFGKAINARFSDYGVDFSVLSFGTCAFSVVTRLRNISVFFLWFNKVIFVVRAWHQLAFQHARVFSMGAFLAASMAFTWVRITVADCLCCATVVLICINITDYNSEKWCSYRINECIYFGCHLNHNIAKLPIFGCLRSTVCHQIGVRCTRNVRSTTMN